MAAVPSARMAPYDPEMTAKAASTYTSAGSVAGRGAGVVAIGPRNLARLDRACRRADSVAMKVGDKKVVRLDYTLKNAQGEVIDTSEGAEPLTYLHGGSQIVPGLERELAGMGAGDAKDVVVQPEDGYGMPDPEGVFGVPRAAFPPDAKLSVGDSFIGENDEGQALPVRVVELR